MPEPELVKIQRGQYSAHFQVTRALLSAASALVNINPEEAMGYLRRATDELLDLKIAVAKANGVFDD